MTEDYYKGYSKGVKDTQAEYAEAPDELLWDRGWDAGLEEGLKTAAHYFSIYENRDNSVDDLMQWVAQTNN